jgi:putative spermidine/putrescine transport system ATP-binding protein
MGEGTRMSLIQFENVSKHYAGKTVVAVDNLNLGIEAGEFLTLLGPSGSGKTTSLMMLAGFERPSTGTIRFDGVSIETLPAHRRNMGVVFQSHALFPHLTVAENVAFPLKVRRLSRSETATRVTGALEKVRLAPFAGRMPHQLSGGQQQRVALARALVFEPRLVLLDEPLSALDKKLREEMQMEIRRLHRELGVTMAFVTHDQSEAMVMSDRVAVFNHGRIEQIGPPQHLYDAPCNIFVAGFLGDNNKVEGKADPEAATLAGQMEIRLANGLALRGRRAGHSTNGPTQTLCVRPESLKVGQQVGQLDTGNRISARLVDIIQQGDHWRLVATLAGEDGDLRAENWTVKVNGGSVPAGLTIGQPVVLGFRPEDAWIF